MSGALCISRSIQTSDRADRYSPHAVPFYRSPLNLRMHCLTAYLTANCRFNSLGVWPPLSYRHRQYSFGTSRSYRLMIRISLTCERDFRIILRECVFIWMRKGTVANYIILRQRFPLSEILLTYGGSCGSVQWIPDQGAVHVS